MQRLLPPELSNLSHLRVLGLSSNRLYGPIPAELGNIETLRNLLAERVTAPAGDLPVLPLTNAAQVFHANYDTHLSETTAVLDQLLPKEITPDLTLLDAGVTSLQVGLGGALFGESISSSSPF